MAEETGRESGGSISPSEMGDFQPYKRSVSPQEATKEIIGEEVNAVGET